MGFYLRKSVKLGPFRVNFSKSGVGVSTGIPGFRIGTGPRGDYVHVERGGTYYKKSLSHEESRPIFNVGGNRNMQSAYTNPANNYTEYVSYPGLWTLLFGFFYFASKGIWRHAIVSLLLAGPTFGLSWLIYPFFAADIVESHYLGKGWVKASDRSFIPTSSQESEPEFQSYDASKFTRKCPACAEIIKLEAIKCRFCAERFDPQEVAGLVAERIARDDFANRVLCGDGTCTGIIGINGRCGVCGKLFPSR